MEPQTAVKHALLRSYIATWMKILWQHQESIGKPPHLIFVDGFAGPGEYWATSERTSMVDGSPIIVGKIANDLIHGRRKLDIIAFDSHRPTVDYLTPRLTALNTKQQSWEVVHGDFSTGARGLMDRLAAKLGRDYPTFFFIDPFGYTGFPMTLLAEILKRERTEVFINFDTYDIVRFIGEADRAPKMLELFGTEEYKEHAKFEKSEERVNFVTSLYRRQLLGMAKAKHAIGFRINTPDQGDRAKYFLFHASSHIKALKEMKNAMARKSDQVFKFEAIGVGVSEQFNLFEATPEAKLKMELLGIIEKAPNNGIEYSKVEDWAYDRTSGVERDIKKALVDLEGEGKVEIQRQPGQQKKTVVKGAKIKFMPTLGI